MKIITDNKNATAYPLQWECSECQSVLEAEGVTDFTITETDVYLRCPLCRCATTVPWMSLTKPDITVLRSRMDSIRMTLTLPYA